MQSRGSPSSQRTTNMLSSRTEMMEARYLFVVLLCRSKVVHMRRSKGGQGRPTPKHKPVFKNKHPLERIQASTRPGCPAARASMPPGAIYRVKQHAS
jgi:hypothetical protein